MDVITCTNQADSSNTEVKPNDYHQNTKKGLCKLTYFYNENMEYEPAIGPIAIETCPSPPVCNDRIHLLLIFYYHNYQIKLIFMLVYSIY